MRLVVVLIVAASAIPLTAFELKPKTLAAFDRYAVLTEARLDRERAGQAPFMWIDAQPERERTKLYARLRAGEVVVARLETRDASKKIDVPDGLIHHWLGTVFFPGITIDKSLRLIQDYDHYPDHFKPMIRQARLRGRDGNRFDVTMQLYTKKVITVVLNAAYLVDYHRIDAQRLWSTSRSTRIAEVDEFGKPGEHEKPVDGGSGFLWRTNLYCHFEERAEGTFEQCESLSLTRDIPFGFGWLIGPFVTGVPREALEFSLGRARADLLKPGL